MKKIILLNLIIFSFVNTINTMQVDLNNNNHIVVIPNELLENDVWGKVALTIIEEIETTYDLENLKELFLTLYNFSLSNKKFNRISKDLIMQKLKVNNEIKIEKIFKEYYIKRKNEIKKAIENEFNKFNSNRLSMLFALKLYINNEENK